MARPKKNPASSPTVTTPPVSFASLQKADGEAAKPAPKSAYEIVGFKLHDYKTSDASVYETGLTTMNLGDLQQECYNQGIRPTTDNRSMLIARLMGKFREETASHRYYTKKDENDLDHLRNNPEQLKSVMAILAKGKWFDKVLVKRVSIHPVSFKKRGKKCSI